MASPSALICLGRYNLNKITCVNAWRFFSDSPQWRRHHFGQLFCCNNCHKQKFSTSIKRSSDEQPIPYSKSAAKKHKVNETFEYDPRRLNATRTFVICFGLLSFVIYYGIIREESETEKVIFEWTDVEAKSYLDSNENKSA